jgi:predicted helicase
MQRSERFLQALQSLKKALPSLRKGFYEQFHEQVGNNAPFGAAFETGFDTLARFFQEEYRRPDRFGVFEHLGTLEPDWTRDQFLTFLVQHFLLEPLLGWMFPDALAQNRIAQVVASVMETFENRAWHRLSVGGYFSVIECELCACTSRAEKQHVLNCVCEVFLNSFDPDRAEELGVIYTPPEVVDFMCESCEEQVRQSYGRSLSSTSVPILDPCTGTGSFLVNIIGRIEPCSLPYKYQHELFGIEIMFLPFYLATLNVEQAFFEHTGQYLPFPGMRYADALLA